MSVATRLLTAAVGGGAAFTPAYWVALSTFLTRIAGGFTKNAGNPVFAKGGGSTWDAWGVREFGIVRDTHCNIVTESDGLWAYYWGRPDGSTGTFKVGLAKSTNSGVTWTRYGGNPVLSPAGTGWYQKHIAQPSVVKQDDGSRVMMVVGTDNSNIEKIGCFTSADGLSWTDRGEKIGGASFLDGATGLSEFGVPCLMKRNSGDWLCLLEGLTSGMTNRWNIYAMTASDPTSTWTVMNSGQPIFSPTGAGWESVGVANPHIIECTPGVYLMVYNGINTYWQIGFASSSDLSTWTRVGTNPVLTKGAGGAWDDQQVETSFLVKDPSASTLLLYYQGYSAVDGSTQIGLAAA